ncbi:MAG: hypothetical protein MUF59_02750 [Candidatus Krumholzibacteria bacterium]|jgi:hypothetical protein|nr:hypothetical protein [Candidatus Krumholzibacteria bacterium]
MNRINGISAAAISAILLAAPAVSFAGYGYVEDFSTTLYRDQANTSAWWDTIAGEVKLFPFASSIIGAFDTPGNAMNIFVSGDYAFVADYGSGLQVIDISDPAHPVLAGTCDTPGSAYAVAVVGDFAFVADYGSGLQVIDISNPSSPSIAGFCDTPGNARDIAVAGDYAFIADYGGSLQVIDISDPSSPSIAGFCDTPGSACGVAVAGDCAFVADWTYGLQTIDISNPTAPVKIGTYDTAGGARSVVLSGGIALIADYNYGLQAIDIRDPANPVLAGTCDTPGNALDVTVSGDRAFVSDYTYGIQVIDISDPAHPVIAETCDTPGSAYGVAIAGDRAFVADYGNGLQVIDICDPVTPALVGRLGGYTDNGFDIAASGDYVFVADGASDLKVFDISDPFDPEFVFPISTPGAAQDLEIYGEYAFVADGYGGLRIIDISEPTSPVLLGILDTPDYSYGVAVSGDVAYVADYSSGLVAVDVGDPSAPAILDSYNTPNYAFDVQLSGDYAFVADYYSGLQVIDISDPADLVYAGSYDTPGNAHGVAVSGDYAFVADGPSGLQVIDIGNPAVPVLAGSLDTPGTAENVVVSGDYAFVADYNSGLQVIDISDPANPELLCSYFSWYTSAVAVSGDCAFLANYAAGIQAVQVFQHEFDSARNIGQSLPLDTSGETILMARLTTAQTDGVSWELKRAYGGTWEEISHYGNWTRLAAPSSSLIWRSTHTWREPGVNPSVSLIDLDWLVEQAVIDSIVDVPGDQGGWVRLHFTRSGRDFADEASLPIMNYGIWRRIDSEARILALESLAEETGDDSPFINHDGRTYLLSMPERAETSLPPGAWEYVMSVSSIQEDSYVAAVPTISDSSATEMNHAVFVVTAHTTTPSVWYTSFPDSGWSVDNIAPAAPVGFAAAYNTGSGNLLSWDPSPEEDFHYFRVYRSSDPGFVPSPADIVHSTTETGWNDPDYDGWNVYYRITAVDYAGNESDPASPGTVTEAGGPEVPAAFALYPNVPNPFNPCTSIRYDVPSSGGIVTLRIYDVGGRLVRTLVDGPQSTGQKTVVWDGRDERGDAIASGVFFYRLQAPGYSRTMKMVVLR